jgi:DNA-binding PadR family transcriptional regulator
MDDNIVKKYIPMTETIFYALLSVLVPRHGYAIMQYVDELTNGRIRLGTGTLYTMVGRLVSDNVIVIASVEGGKKSYQITSIGQELLNIELVRLEKQLQDGRNVLQGEGDVNE